VGDSTDHSSMERPAPEKPEQDDPMEILEDATHPRNQDEPQDSPGGIETTSIPQVEKRPANGEGSQSEFPVSSGHEVGFSPLLDLLRTAAEGKISLVRLVLDGNKVGWEYGTSFVHKGRQHYVPELAPNLSHSLTLPTRPRGFGSARDLFNSIVALLRNHAMLAERECSLLAYWSMATWFVDFLPFIPALAITGPAFAADLLFRALTAVCRRPVSLADVSPAALRAMPLGELMPTLLIRAPRLSKRLGALLDASNQPGYLVCNGKDFQNLYCAKCIYIGEHGGNHLLTANSVHVHVGGNLRRFLPSPPSDEVIDDFQSRLLCYRFAYHDVVVASKVRAPGFQFRPEVSAMAQALSLPVEHDPELRRGIIELLQERDQQSRVDRAIGQEGIVLRAVLWHCHQPEAQQVFVREIAATANEMYRQEGESLKIGNEAVGHVLKNLGLYTRRLGNAGRGLVLDKTMQARVHELGYANEVLLDSGDASACGYCHKLQVSEIQELV